MPKLISDEFFVKERIALDHAEHALAQKVVLSDESFEKKFVERPSQRAGHCGGDFFQKGVLLIASIQPGYCWSKAGGMVVD